MLEPAFSRENSSLLLLMVEPPVYQEHLQQWWQSLGSPQTVEIARIGSGITVYKKTLVP